MRILLINDTYDEKAGGAEKHFFQLIKELKIKGFEVYSMGFANKTFEGKDYKTLKETNSLILRHFWRLFFNPIKYFQIKKYVDKIKPDVIHIHNINKYTFSLIKAIKKYKVVMTVHDYSLIDPSMWNVHKNLKPCKTGFRKSCFWEHKRSIFPIYMSQVYFFYKRNQLLKKIVKKFISPSVILKRYLIKNGFSNVDFVPLFIESNNINPDFNKMKKEVIYIGKLEKNKGIEILMNAFKNLPGIKIKIIGKGSLEKKLKKIASKNVEFISWTNDLDKFYKEASIVVVPSIWMEQFGLVTAEAMMHYRPVIGSNIGNTPWLVKNNKTGLIYDPLNEKELQEKIKYLIKNKRKIKEFGLNARRRIESICNKDAILKKIIKIYEAVV